MFTSKLSNPSSAFNRTRLECKFLSIYGNDMVYRRFNRTRLECKCVYGKWWGINIIYLIELD